ncbi:MAG: hypothetical protein F7C07_06405 [Desulfurococcales archaeon]|nr:hypothetical protein [Desulfurococcales archaeon]
MELIAELVDARSREELIRKAETLLTVFDAIDIPDSPLGKPSIHSVTASLILSEALGADVIAHIRVIDYNRLAIESLLKTLRMSRIARLVFLRGDPPRGSTALSDYSPEEALLKARKALPGARLGLLLSLRKSLEEILERMRLAPDFMLVLNLSSENIGFLERVAGEAKRVGVKLYPYIIVESEKNRDLLAGIGQPRVRSGESLEGLVESIEGLVDGVLLSCPLDYEHLVGVASRIARK